MRMATLASLQKKSGGETPPPSSLERNSSGELGEQRLGFAFLLVVAFVQHLLKDLAGAFDIAHFLIGLGEIELRRGVVPLPVEHRRRRIFERRALRVECEVELVELDRRGGPREF